MRQRQGQAERPQLAPIFLRDVNPSHPLEPVALVAQRIDDAPDPRSRGLPGKSW